jgi:hypothetical protein
VGRRKSAGQGPPNAYLQNWCISGVDVGPVIITWVSRTPTVPVDRAT